MANEELPPETTHEATDARRTVAESMTVDAKRFRLAEEAREVRDRHREALEALRQEREQMREASELARVAGEEARQAADQARHAAMDAVQATADVLQTTLTHMKAVEEMRRTLREIPDDGDPRTN